MKILSVAHAVPSWPVDNDYWLEKIRVNNRHLSREQLACVERRVERYFEDTGTRVRFFLADGEKAIDLVRKAGRAALESANIDRRDIDLLIYAGVGRGWLEPAMAAVVQRELGLTSATAFDVLDACASWLRALHIASMFIRHGNIRRVMIVNCEASLMGYANVGRADDPAFESRLATMTIGEAATATIVGDECRDDDVYFRLATFPDDFLLCMIPLSNASDFVADGDRVPEGDTKFFAHSRELVMSTVRRIIEVYVADSRLKAWRYDICFGHAAGEKVECLVRRQLGIPDETYFGTHARFGNTVAATIPLAMSAAIEEGRFKRGDRALIVVGSAGVSVGFCTFTF